MTEAVDHIHKYGSGHTEAIITENAATAQVRVCVIVVY
jgi:gamma-glutamyl phosphate reductase